MTEMTFSSISGAREIEFSRDSDGLHALITERGDGYAGDCRCHHENPLTIGFPMHLHRGR